MMSIKGLWLIVILLLVFNAVLLIRLGQMNNADITAKDEEATVDNSINVQDVESKLRTYYENNGQQIEESLELTKSDGTVVNLDSLLCSPKLVFNLNHITCRICLEDELKRIQKFAKGTGRQNVLLIMDDYTRREMYVVENQLDLSIFKIRENSFGLPADELKQPYLFVLSNDYTVRDLFIPFAEYEFLSDSYYRIIKNRYW